MNTKRQKLMIMIIPAAIVLLIGVLAMPRTPQLSEQASGDRALIDTVRDQLHGSVRDRVSVAVIDGDTVRTATFGAGRHDSYEIASLTKTFTGSLLAIAIQRGEVTEQTRLGELLELGDSPVGQITLVELATQSSGLPPVPTNARATTRSILASLRSANPYLPGRETMITMARDTPVGEKTHRYSNLGFALLGEALVAAAGAPDYGTLVAERITEPLRLTGTRIGTTDDRPTGYAATGRAADNWDMSGYAGAGALRSTLPDMITYLRAQADQTAPGVRATRPIAPAGRSRIGYAWLTTDGVTWHNGMTGGFASFAGFDPDSRRAVVVLSNTAVSVDELGMSLLKEEA